MFCPAVLASSVRIQTRLGSLTSMPSRLHSAASSDCDIDVGELSFAYLESKALLFPDTSLPLLEHCFRSSSSVQLTHSPSMASLLSVGNHLSCFSKVLVRSSKPSPPAAAAALTR
eukprot:CAMPEP_0115098608 /NCGR_PEP_ID=MMETSP0227-20121206/31276_1 /TAXON_ID=89957 /ORGANISM="Polarella glacialis, Strain CCMP 1383" /LENGTH=114 /DNA_ID=CAMNT_0002493277 /DNA_START=217 /DNA_END=561 /DNA_ORIENTATION=+